jgi:hypothetical protein
VAYFSRHYRVRQEVNLPGLPVTRTVVALDEFLAGKWGADNGAVQLVVAPLAADRRFRTLKAPTVFTAVLRTVPLYPQLRAAASYHPTAFRAFWQINGMVCPPEGVYTDPHVIACARQALSQHGSGPPVAQPTRDQLLAALAG